MKNFLVLALLLGMTLPVSAADFANWEARGNVLQVEIYRDATTNAYVFTRLILAMSPSDSTLFPSPNDYYVVNYDFNLGAGAFLQSSACTPVAQTSFSSFYMGRPIDKNVTMERYTCKPGAGRGAGECVLLQGKLLHVFTQSTGNQVLWPWVETISYEESWNCS